MLDLCSCRVLTPKIVTMATHRLALHHAGFCVTLRNVKFRAWLASAVVGGGTATPAAGCDHGNLLSPCLWVCSWRVGCQMWVWVVVGGKVLLWLAAHSLNFVVYHRNNSNVTNPPNSKQPSPPPLFKHCATRRRCGMLYDVGFWANMVRTLIWNNIW